VIGCVGGCYLVNPIVQLTLYSSIKTPSLMTVRRGIRETEKTCNSVFGDGTIVSLVSPPEIRSVPGKFAPPRSVTRDLPNEKTQTRHASKYTLTTITVVRTNVTFPVRVAVHARSARFRPVDEIINTRPGF